MRGTLGRRDRTRLHAKATSDTRWFSCCRCPTRPVPRAVGRAFDQPAADPGIRASRIDAESAARTATAPAHLLMTGLILDSLPEEPRHQPCWFANCAPVRMALSVMYITESVERAHFFMCMFLE